MAEIESTRRDLVVHLFVQGKPVLASFGEGGGTVWVVGTSYPFFNYGLRDEASARLVMNLLADVPPEAAIGFDERQLLVTQESEQSGLNDWLVSTPAGWSLIVLVVLVMGYLLLRGRRFGRPQPILAEQLRREPTEYIQAVATLFRRSGQRGEVLRHYKSELLRWLTTRYALEPRLNDDELVRILAVRDPALDTGALADLLRDLSARHVTEQQLVQIIMRVDGWIGEKR
ncbi:MAG: hypothetical protein EHM39_14205 [Chloroflexi bacterium]|nr:MAG: hypothetical protein EHM39_14205 [Chloroflexota bacterium]